LGEGRGEGKGLNRREDMDILTRARLLRKNQTEAEKLLWWKLRSHQLEGHKFKRQVPIGPYIVDFQCMSAMLIVEIDGGHHADRKQSDEKRTRFLERKGYTVVRFWNNEVLTNIEGVLSALTLTLSQREREQKTD